MTHEHTFEDLSESGYEGVYCTQCAMEYTTYQTQELVKSNSLDLRPVIAKTMRICGWTYQEIGNALGISKQAVNKMIK